MATLTTEQTTRLARMAGEGHKAAADRMLDDADLDQIATDVALMKDSEGRAPTETDYVTTVDLYRAAAECWRTKAGMVADGFDFEAEGASFTRSQVYDHYMEQAGRFATMAAQLTTAVKRPATEDETSDFDEWLEGGGGI